MTTNASSSDVISGRTEVLHGEHNVIRSELDFFSNSHKKIDTCMNYTRPPLAITIEPIRGAFIDAKKRHVKSRYLTEINKDNISYCKELISLVDELRHLDGIKGNFMVSESEYLAPIILFEKGKIAPQIIYSNQKEIVNQHQYMFDTLWNKALPTQQRVKEIEEGITEGEVHNQTRFLENAYEVSEEIKKLINNTSDDDWSICSTFNGLLMISSNEDFEMQGRRFDINRRGKSTRWVGAINKDNVHLVKAYIDLGMKIRHINNMPPMNFALSSKELYITIDEMKGGQIAKNLLITSELPYIRHYNSIFEDLWNKSIPAEQKIKEIEEGVISGRTEVIQSPKDIQQVVIDMVKSAKHEVLLVLPTINTFYREERIGIIELLKQAAKRDHKVNVRILTPTDDAIEKKLQDIVLATEQNDIEEGEEGSKRKQQMKNKENNTFDIRRIDVQSTNEDDSRTLAVAPAEKTTVTTVTILIVDKKESLVIEKVDDSKQDFIEAVGVATYSNSKPTVLSYVSIFENLWKQTELYQQLKESTKQLELAYEQLKISDRMQKEFINIAAHELRTPIQPILGLSQMIYSKIDEDRSPHEKQKQKEMLEVVTRNANRLQRLTEDILDVTRIESQNLNLKLELLNLDEIISNSINDAKRSHEFKTNVSLLYEHDKDNGTVFVQADKARLNQVLSNLISNAIKFTQEGSIIITSKKEEKKEHKIIVSVKDSGTGIDPEILPRLFQKFATKSYHGTGLGLYISKSIVEAHGGEMWAENNSNGKGSTFYFTLPLFNRKNDVKSFGI